MTCRRSHSSKSSSSLGRTPPPPPPAGHGRRVRWRWPTMRTTTRSGSTACWSLLPRIAFMKTSSTRHALPLAWRQLAAGSAYRFPCQLASPQSPLAATACCAPAPLTHPLPQSCFWVGMQAGVTPTFSTAIRSTHQACHSAALPLRRPKPCPSTPQSPLRRNGAGSVCGPAADRRLFRQD